jgi:ABC-type branched-subunit amino acid transport system permease subunit/aromatic ring-opening dioxygenase catalytic subunit (LigB family)
MNRAAAPQDASPAGYLGGWLLAILVVVLLLVPTMVDARSYWLHLLFTVFVFAVFGHAWNLLAGYCGLLSFGNQVFVGVGGFALALVHYYGGWGIWTALACAGVAGLLFAWLLAIPLRSRFDGRRVLRPVAVALVLWIVYEALIAYVPGADVFRSTYVRRVSILLLIFLGALPLLKLQGAYFAIATWLVAESVATVFNEWEVVGAGGGMQIKSDVTLPQLYYASLVLLMIATLAIWRLLRSRYGLALTAVRDDEEAARAVGVDIRGVKSGVFVLAGTFTSLAAGLYYLDAVIITPPAAFNISWSAYFVFIVVAGGMGTLAGPIIGAVVFVIIDRLLAGYAGGGLLVLGIASIVLIFLLPRGVMGVVGWLRHFGPEDAARTRHRWRSIVDVVLGVRGRARSSPAERQPGVVAAFLVPGNPLPLLVPDNAPWKVLAEGYEKARVALAAARPDVILLYSTQWIAVLDQLWQGRPRILGQHVDENWHQYGSMRYDLRIDTSLAKACVAAASEEGIKSKLVDYEGFPIDSGTIVAMHFLNPNKDVPVLIAANNLYHDWATTQRLAAIACEQAVAQGKRVALVGLGGLSGTFFREEVDPADDRIASASDDTWNKELLRLMTEGRIEEIAPEVPQFVREAKGEMGMKHLAWILGGAGERITGAVVHAYGPTYGAGAAIVQFRLAQ